MVDPIINTPLVNSYAKESTSRKLLTSHIAVHQLLRSIGLHDNTTPVGRPMSI